jgi:DNA-binding NarL/FixJ family response regulator
MVSRGQVTSYAAARAALRLFVIDHHPIVHDGMVLLAQHTSWVEVVGCARSGREALAAVGKIHPDVALLDLRLPDMLGCEVVAGLRARVPQATIVIFTASADRAAIGAARMAGAHAVLLKAATQAEILALLDRIRSGEVDSWPAASCLVEDRRSNALKHLGMTRREYDVLRRLALGETNPQIADALYLSRNTVKSYLKSVFAKLGARNRVEALVRAGQLDLL